MSTEFTLYLMTRANAVQDLFGVSGVLVLLGAGVCILVYFMIKHIEEIDIPWLPALSKKLLFIGIFLNVISAAIPTKNDLLFIYGGSKLIDAVQSNRAANIGNKTLDAVEKWLEEAAPTKGAKP